MINDYRRYSLRKLGTTYKNISVDNIKLSSMVVNCMLTWLGHRLPRLNIFSGVSVRVLPDEISIYISGPSKVDYPPIYWVSIIQSAEDLSKTKNEGRKNVFLFCLPAWAGTLVFSCTWTGIHATGPPDSQGFKLAGISPPLSWVSAHRQTADHGTISYHGDSLWGTDPHSNEEWKLLWSCLSE